MTINFLYYILLICSNSLLEPYDDKFVDKNNLTPIGTVFIGDGLYMDETEISNLNYRDFLLHIKNNSSDSYYKSLIQDTTISWQLPDSAIVIDETGIGTQSISYDEYVISELRHYHLYPGYWFCPAVGISYYQANEFCKWRSKFNTDQANKKLQEKNKAFRVEYTYHLPSILEWEKSIDSLIPKRNLSNKVLKRAKESGVKMNKETYFYNACIKQTLPKTADNNELLIEGTNFIGWVYSNKPNSKDLYNTYGNVSEMTSQEGVSFGGSWIHDKKEVEEKVFEYDKPCFWLGFRCACTVKIIKI